MRISQRSIEEVREAANIVEVASEFTALRRQGARFAGLCPYPDHQEKTPSFSVSPDRGFYYCFGCLEANELIWTSRGLIPIAAAEVGDEVIGQEGRRETITDKWFKSAPTMRIRTGAAKEGIELTPDHWCIFLKREEALRAISAVHLKYSGGEEIGFSRKLRGKDLGARLSIEHASGIREGDFWLYPVVPDEDRENACLWGEHVVKPYTKGPRTERITRLNVNTDTAWLYGLWLAEGSLYRGGVKWSFGADEAESLAKRTMLILEKEFGRRSTRFVRTDKNFCEVTCSSTDLAVLFGYWFGRGCANKQVPIEAMNWTVECQAALIEGYVAGDGHTGNGVTSVATVSQELAYGVFALCVQARKVCSLSTTPARTGQDEIRRRKTYYVHILSKESLKGFFAKIDGINYFLSVVQEVETAEEGPTTVVDITTTGSHTFLTKMGMTHNCQRGGDAIKLVTDLKNLSFGEAVSYLAERSGVELQFEGSASDSEAARRRSLRRRTIHKALAAAAVYYHKYLLGSRSPQAEHARDYLRGRGIEISTIEEFRLGYAPARGGSGFLGAARRLDFDRNVLEEAGLLSARGGERFSGRITFPISDRRGRIVGFGARAMGDDHPKYLNSPETEIFNKRNLLYGFPQVSESIRKERAALVVEGYTDVLMLYQSGIKNAVATLGTATTPGHLRTLSGYADRIYVVFDPDAAGEKAIERAAATAAELRLDLRVLRLSEDPADWLLKHQPDEFVTLLGDAAPALQYVLRRTADRARGTDPAERARMVSEMEDFIDQIEDPVFRQDALRIASEALGVTPEVLRSRRGKLSGTPIDSFPRPAQTDPLEHGGRELLALALAYPGLVAELLRNGLRTAPLPEPVVLEARDFADDAQAKVFSLLQEHAGENVEVILADEQARPYLDFISALVSQGTKNVITTDRHRRGEKVLPSKADIAQAWIGLKLLSRERTKRQSEDFDEKERIRNEIQELREALRTVSAEP